MQTARLITAFALAVLSCFSAAANCDPCVDPPGIVEVHLSAWPAVEVQLPTNARVLVEQSYASAARAPLADLSSRRPRLQVVGTHTEIALRVLETLDGQCSASQAVLAPDEPLPPGAKVRLLIDDTTPNAPSGNTYAPAEWVVAAGPDTTPPTWTKPPALTAPSVLEMGCGPSVFVNASVEGLDAQSSALLARVTVEGPEPGRRTTTALVPVVNNTLSAGHGMCHGLFRWGQGEHAMHITLEDLSGNQAPAPITLKIPTPRPNPP